ncbi:hypothetical protein [Kitasatospora sp. HPMI-4]|uniref:hypothetical protein n=1 Tax=Kitasatospora sp. HPMI-4 TaxID=3448443 RepID=UPI003F1DB9DC
MTATAVQRPSLAELLEQTSPATRATQAAAATVPVLPPLAPLLPYGGLAKGTVTEVSDTGLALALAAGPADATPATWSAVVGMPDLGLAAAVGYGWPMARMLLVDDLPDEKFAEIVRTLAGPCALVLACPPARMEPRTAARLGAHLRSTGTILIACGNPWPGAQLKLTVAAATWSGLGDGWGQLRQRQADVIATGRGSASRPRKARLLLPDEYGRVSVPVVDSVSRPVAGAGAAAV